jgi:hypothetical protein
MAARLHWAEDPSQLDAFVERLDSDASARRNLDRFLLRLYHGRPIPAPVDGQRDGARPSSVLVGVENMRANGYNLCRTVGDAAAALVVRLPAMKVLPVGQQFKRQRGAKLMSRYLNGVFYANKVKRLAPALFNDEICTRLGALKAYVDRKTYEIKYERMNSLWLLWDEGEGPNPQSLYYCPPASRRYLAARWPKFAGDILNAPRWEPTTVPMVGFGRPNDDDRVKVIEAWSLPVGDLPGRHVIKVGRSVALLDEPWEFDRFPVVPFRWTDGRTADGTGSYGGKPLCEVIYDHHVANNKIMRIMLQCAQGALPKLLAHEKSEITALTSKMFETVIYRGPTAPQLVVPSTISADWWRLRDLIKADAYELAGVNQQAAQGTTGGQLVSAPAQRERMDIVSTRLIHPTEGFEQAWREVGEVTVMLASKAYRNREARVRAPGTRLLEEISWQDIDLREDEYSITVESTAALPLTVGGRLDFVSDLMQLKDETGAPVIKARDGLKMLQVPDTEAALDRETAAQDLADHQVEQALWEGAYIPPEPIQDLAMLIDTASKELMRALQNPTWPDDNLELCRRLIAEAKMLQGGPAPQPGAPPPPMPAPVPAPGPGPGMPEAIPAGAPPPMAA